MPGAAAHLVPLGTTSWSLWRDAALRSAGFAARQLLGICDTELAVAADLLAADGSPAAREHYEKVYGEATERLRAATRATALDGRFREAVTWQNPGLVGNCLDKAAAGEPRNVRGRNHETAIASYLQRYCLKNDTVGFFGPVGWARVGEGDLWLAVSAGEDLLARRTTYFEAWAIEAVADTIAARPEVLPWLRPRRAPSGVLTGRILRLPFRKPVVLSAQEARLLERCDGSRTVRDLAGDPIDQQTLAALLRLREVEALAIGLKGPSATWPERELAQRIDAIGDEAVRARARAPVAELVAARDAVAAAAGDPQRLHEATGTLSRSFERITGTAATRRPGATYAGRTLVYEDTVRAVDVELGRRLTGALAPALGLLLDSAAWLVNEVGERYRQLFRQLLERERSRTGSDTVPLAGLVATAMPQLFTAVGRPGSDLVDEVVEEFQRRWAGVLGLPDGARRHRAASGEIAGRVASTFATGPPLWSGARQHSPDVMIAAASPEDLCAGDFEFVLGEVHLASNTLESRLFVAQHPQPERLRAAAAADHQGCRVYTIPRQDSPLVTPRLAPPPGQLSPHYAYLCIGAESVEPHDGARRLPAVDLLVERAAGGVVVNHRADGQRYDLLDVIGDLLSVLVSTAFRPFAPAGHQPRVSIDRMVIGRESWTFPAAEAAWAFVKDERERYAGARRWRASHGMPERAFVTVPVERKPTGVDFRSLPLVNLLAKSIRRTAETEAARFTVSEMMPDTDRLWLCDANGERYTSELRFVAVRAAPEEGSR